MRKLLLLAAAVTVGCSAAEGPDDEIRAGSRQATGAGSGGGSGGSAGGNDGAGYFDEEPNGRWVLGAALDVAPYSPAGASSYFSVGSAATRRGLPQKVTFAGAASLSSSGADGTFGGADLRIDGLVFAEGALRVTIAVAGGDAELTHYSLDVQHGSGPVTRVCDDAIPLTGVMDRSGEHVVSPGRITFACSDGAAHKCAVWGYPAGTSGSALWGAHQACMQMVTADYCADGAASTRVGTSIRFYDDVGVHQIPAGTQIPAITSADWPPNTVDYYFEGAFVGLHAEALCLGKLRWPMITSRCATQLPDCPGGTVDGLIEPHGAVLFVASKYNQLRLDRWQRREGTVVVDRVATVRGYFNANDQAIKPPWDGYTHEGHDGVLLRVPPDSLPEADRIEVAVFRRLATGDRFVARSDDARFASSPAFAHDGFEGYVFTDQAPGQQRRQLRLYRRPDTGERMATTLEPAAMAGLGYDLDPDAAGSAVIGWIAPAP